MNSQERRIAVEARLRSAAAPLSATALAGEFHVSRQVIVGDVALLRASGVDIHATPRGYVLGSESAGVQAVLACTHTCEDMGRELTVMVDNGCEVLDVIVEHPVYGQLTGQLRLRSRHDVAEFLKKAEGASPLSALTGGIHLHTVRCPDRETLERVTQALKAEGFLLEG
ncbi:MAG: transcription repressor NadR [Oscillospiraceae bacterium]